MQLDAYMEQGKQLTNQPPPVLAFEDHEPEIIEFDVDEEDRILEEPEWPEFNEYDIEETQQRTEMNVESKASQIAPELAPSVSSKGIPESVQEPVVEPHHDDVVRIRILESSDDPIMDEHGNEIELQVGDVHMLEADTAQWLIDTGLAENAQL